VADHGGFAYDSDYYGDDLPFWLQVRKTDGSLAPHLVVPYTLDCNDMRFALPQGFSHRRRVLPVPARRLRRALRRRRRAPKMMSIGMHCRLLGRPGRMRALQRFLDHVQRTTACGSRAASTSPATGRPRIPSTPPPPSSGSECP
jgi:allantoinase